MSDSRAAISYQSPTTSPRQKPGESLCSASWTCSAVAACAAIVAMTLAHLAYSPISGLALLAALIFLVGTWGGGLIGVICGLIALASPTKRAAKPLAPLLVNLAVVVGFTLFIKLCHIGPSFHGGPGGF
jgi:Na+-transporting NADH:ubiquinone oxidoreductase subunit NqrB